MSNQAIKKSDIYSVLIILDLLLTTLLSFFVVRRFCSCIIVIRKKIVIKCVYANVCLPV